jgi:hypothetical protein
MDPIYFKLGVIVLVGVSTLLYWIFNFTILYHLIRFGVGQAPKNIAMIFSLGCIGLFFVSSVLFASIDFDKIAGSFEKINLSVPNLATPI